MADELLSGLDPEQRAVAEHLRGPAVVLAGAGTGKTRTITHRIAHGVRTGVYAADRTLAVTFTRKAAAEMQSRLRALGADGVRAQTFHGAALAQLGYFWPAIVGGTAPQVLGGKVRVVSQVLDALGIRAGVDAVRDIAAEIEWRKVSMLSLDAYARLLESARPSAGGLDPQQMLEVHERYGLLLEERRQIDFEDVLILMAGMLETEPRVAAQVRERYRFFTVDEYQDLSPLQHTLLRGWLGERQDLCVVGDASQTIYGFAGATSDYLLGFTREYPAAREFSLERNYRSAPSIVAAANDLVRDRAGALVLRATRVTPEVGLAPHASAEWFASEQEEAAAVASSVAQAIADGTPAAEIAVLSRTNAQAAVIEAELDARGIASQMQGARRFFDRPEIRQAVMLIRGQAKAADERPLFQVVTDLLRSLGWSTAEPEGAAARDRWQAFGALLALVDEQTPGTTLEAFSEELLSRSKTHHEPTLEAVTLSAIHAAKGLEWSLVHVIGMSEGLLPISYATTERAIDEERRLAYVALTRARDVLRVSGSSGSPRNPRTPSRFIAEAGLRTPRE